jgi:hypothetical protein
MPPGNDPRFGGANFKGGVSDSFDRRAVPGFGDLAGRFVDLWHSCRYTNVASGDTTPERDCQNPAANSGRLSNELPLRPIRMADDTQGNRI